MEKKQKKKVLNHRIDCIHCERFYECELRSVKKEGCVNMKERKDDGKK